MKGRFYMKSILHELYGGEINPYENISVSSNEYRAVNRKTKRRNGISPSA